MTYQEEDDRSTLVNQAGSQGREILLSEMCQQQKIHEEEVFA
jgi:hypothetical protein